MTTYVTHSDSSYASRMILMIESLRKYDSLSPIFVHCHDSKTTNMLKAAGLHNIHIIDNLEAVYPEIVSLRESRSYLEYLYSLSPYLIEYVFLETSAESVTYLDADIYFFNDPNLLTSSDKRTNVTIVSHQFPEKFSHLQIFGRYNVGWLEFKNTEEGRSALNWWKLKCKESTSSTLRGDVYGDQKYLDSLPSLFSGVKVRENTGQNVAPWNLFRNDLGLKDGNLEIEGNIFFYFHFSGFRVLQNYYLCGLSHYSYRNRAIYRKLIYKPYIEHFEDLHHRLGLDVEIDTRPMTFKMHLKSLFFRDFLIR